MQVLKNVVQSPKLSQNISSTPLQRRRNSSKNQFAGIKESPQLIHSQSNDKQKTTPVSNNDNGQRHGSYSLLKQRSPKLIETSNTVNTAPSSLIERIMSLKHHNQEEILKNIAHVHTPTKHLPQNVAIMKTEVSQQAEDQEENKNAGGSQTNLSPSMYQQCFSPNMKSYQPLLASRTEQQLNEPMLINNQNSGKLQQRALGGQSRPGSSSGSKPTGSNQSSSSKRHSLQPQTSGSSLTMARQPSPGASVISVKQRTLFTNKPSPMEGE